MDPVSPQQTVRLRYRGGLSREEILRWAMGRPVAMGKSMRAGDQTLGFVGVKFGVFSPISWISWTFF